MMTGNGGDTQREVRLSVDGLSALRSAVHAACDGDAAARSLQRAGVALGRAIYADIARAGDPAALAPAEFWERALDALRERGWGDYVHRSVHAGAGELATSNGAEVTSRGSRPDCFLSAGLIAGLLAGVDAGPVAVLEVECRSQGDAECRFLFGGRDTIAAVHSALLRGEPVDDAVEALG
ncbi:MAG TPA: V4R domain-containing protein [Longimicrobiales bacterium]|nr:V4R domain-containing protein [Longimicrobiales bacterium]